MHYLPLLRQPALVIAGDEDPIIPTANALRTRGAPAGDGAGSRQGAVKELMAVGKLTDFFATELK